MSVKHFICDHMQILDEVFLFYKFIYSGNRQIVLILTFSFRGRLHIIFQVEVVDVS
jgi:hypothetical protein